MYLCTNLKVWISTLINTYNLRSCRIKAEFIYILLRILSKITNKYSIFLPYMVNDSYQYKTLYDQIYFI
jgi:hypothetical protein